MLNQAEHELRTEDLEEVDHSEFYEHLSEHAKQPVTYKMLRLLLKHISKMHHLMNQKNVERNRRIVALEAQVAALEARPGNGPGVAYAGTHDVKKSYVRGELVTRSGGLWLVLNNVDAEAGHLPGSSPHFKLVVKAGAAA